MISVYPVGWKLQHYREMPLNPTQWTLKLWWHVSVALTACFCCLRVTHKSLMAVLIIEITSTILYSLSLIYQGLFCLNLFLEWEKKKKSWLWIPFLCILSPPPVSSTLSLVRHAEWRPIMSLCLFQLTHWAVWGCDVSLVKVSSLPLSLSPPRRLCAE